MTMGQQDLSQTFASFDDAVNPVTGFLPSDLPLKRLPQEWEAWEATLDDAISNKLPLGARFDISDEDVKKASSWQDRVKKLPLLPTERLVEDEVLARRAHLVLAFILHFYIHSLPPQSNILIPPSIGVPLLRMSNHLEIPADVTYSDTVLYNFSLRDPSAPLSIENICSYTMFTNSLDEEEFYLASTRIELAGVPGLNYAREIMIDLANGSNHDIPMITSRLRSLETLIHELKAILLAVKNGCRPDQYYEEVRPWFSGEDSDLSGRKWIFDGLEDYPDLGQPVELSGPSAGQSALVHAFDAFLGITNSSKSPNGGLNFQQRMRFYMPKRHREFLQAIDTTPFPLRDFVMQTADPGLSSAYNGAVNAMKEWRDAHMIIATLYIVSPARRAQKARAARAAMSSMTSFSKDTPVLKGTGGTDLVRFLKSVRTNTSAAMISS